MNLAAPALHAVVYQSVFTPQAAQRLLDRWKNGPWQRSIRSVGGAGDFAVCSIEPVEPVDVIASLCAIAKADACDAAIEVQIPQLERYRHLASMPVHDDLQDPNRWRSLVGMVRPADDGGVLLLHLNDVSDPVAVHLNVGDVVIYDSGTRHQVTPVLAGTRYTVVTTTRLAGADRLEDAVDRGIRPPVTRAAT